MSLVPKGLQHHHEELFTASVSTVTFLIRLVFSYLDDFIFAGFNFHFCALQVAAFDKACEMLGLLTLPSKFEPPATSQTILGVVYSALLGSVALKDKKPDKVRALLESFESRDVWRAKDIESLCGNLVWLSFFLPRIRAFVTPILIALVIANATPKKFIQRSLYPQLMKPTSDALKFLIYVVSLDPCNDVFRFLDLYPARKIISYTDASGFELSPKNPSPGCIAGFFDAPPGLSPFAFAIPWATIQAFLPNSKELVKPHINYLELVAPIILFLWLCIFYPKFVKHHMFVIKLDSQVTQFWVNNGRVSTLPFCYLLQLLAIFEWRYDCKVVIIYIKGTRNPADCLSRRPFWQPWIFYPKTALSRSVHSPIPIRKVPHQVLRLITKAISGNLDYQQLFQPSADRFTFARRQRFDPPHLVLFVFQSGITN